MRCAWLLALLATASMTTSAQAGLPFFRGVPQQNAASARSAGHAHHAHRAHRDHHHGGHHHHHHGYPRVRSLSLHVGALPAYNYYPGGLYYQTPYNPYWYGDFYLPRADAYFSGSPLDLYRLPAIAAEVERRLKRRAAAGEEAPEATGRMRVSNAESRRRSLTLLARGDELFQEQQYHEAAQRYKKAAAIAPDVAEAYLRQGHALLATGRFELAANAFKRGLAVDPNIRRGGFRLDDLYRDTRAAKASHLDNLARSAFEHTHDADLFFLLGLFLHYDGQPDRAVKFFRRAAELAGKDDAHLRHFLPAEKIGKSGGEAEVKRVEL